MEEIDSMIMEQLSDTKRFTTTEQQIIDFIHKHPHVVVNLSLQELSQECFVSQASIIRLSKKLGVKGFAAFKVQLAQELIAFVANKQDISVDIPIPENSNCEEISNIFYNLSQQTLQTTFHNLDYAAIQKVASMLSNAESIHLFGRGESLIIAEDFHYKLLRLGYPSVLESLNGFQEVYSGLPREKHSNVAMVISQYCNSQHTRYIIDELMSNHIPMVLVTAATKAWPYDKYADVTLRIANMESRHKMGSFASRTAFLFLLDCVFGQLFSLHYKQNAENLKNFSTRRVAREYYYKIQQENKR